MFAPSAEHQDASASARRFVDTLTSLEPRSPAYTDHAARLQATGRAQVRESLDLTERTATRWAAGAAGTGAVVDALRTTRATLGRLEPKEGGLRRLLGRRGADLSAERLAAARPQIEGSLRSLTSAVDALRRDAAAAQADADALAVVAGRLHERADALSAVEDELTAAEQRRGGMVDYADVRALARERRQELLTQEAVTAQGALAVTTAGANAAALVDAADRARRVTGAILAAADAAGQLAAFADALVDLDAAIGAGERGR